MRILRKITAVVIIALSLLIACDDFFSPTIEIFNENVTPTEIELRQKQGQKASKKNSNNQEIINENME